MKGDSVDRMFPFAKRDISECRSNMSQNVLNWGFILRLMATPEFWAYISTINILENRASSITKIQLINSFSLFFIILINISITTINIIFIIVIVVIIIIIVFIDTIPIIFVPHNRV